MVAASERAGDVGERRRAALLGLEPVGKIGGGTAATRRHRSGDGEQDGQLTGLLGGLRGGGDLLRQDLDLGLGRFEPLGTGVLAHDDVRVRATETESGHTGDGATGVARPLRTLGDDLQVRAVERDVRVGRGVVERRRKLIVLHRENDLDETGRTGGGLEVTEVGLGRTEQDRLVVLTPTTDDTAERVGSIGSPSTVPVPCASM